MTDVPIKSHLTSPTTTEVQFQTALGAIVDVLNELSVVGEPEQLAIVLDVVTPTKCHIVVDTENLSASDQLAQILPTNIGAKTIFVRCKSTVRPVTLMHKAGGTGSLNMANTSNVTLENERQMIAFVYNTSTQEWDELWRNWGIFLPTTSAAALARAALGLSAAAQAQLGVGSGQIPTANMLGSLAFLSVIGATHILNDTINTGHIVDQAISLQKMKSDASNKGKAIGYDPVSGLVAPLALSSTGNMLIYKDAGTYNWIVPDGVTRAKAWVIGGGGGGTGVNLSQSDPVTGGRGGTSSFGSFLSATGGYSSITAGDGVLGSGLELGGAFKGGAGEYFVNKTTTDGGMPYFYGPLGPGDQATFSPSINYVGTGGKWPGGGAAGRTRAGYTSGVGAGSGGSAFGYCNVTPGQSISITVGAGGTAAGGNYGTGRPGAAGMVLVEW